MLFVESTIWQFLVVSSDARELCFIEQLWIEFCHIESQVSIELYSFFGDNVNVWPEAADATDDECLSFDVSECDWVLIPFHFNSFIAGLLN